MNSSDTAQIFLEDVRVPASNIIGEEGKGFLYQMLQVDHDNCHIPTNNGRIQSF